MRIGAVRVFALPTAQHLSAQRRLGEVGLCMPLIIPVGVFAAAATEAPRLAARRKARNLRENMRKHEKTGEKRMRKA